MNQFSTICLGALALTALLLSSAQSAVVVTKPSDLDREPGIGELKRAYLVFASANVVFAQCAPAYGLTKAQTDYETEQFKSIADEYSKAYFQAYAKRVGAQPDQQWVVNITDYITKQQLPVVDATSSAITQKGCADDRFRRMIQYVEDVHHSERVVQAQEEAKKQEAAAKRRAADDAQMDNTQVVTQPIDANHNGIPDNQETPPPTPLGSN